MVKQARDQLQSNETQEEIKEVFEGSCKLIPIKIISNECCKIADNFIPELIDTLASEMNPQVVCATAGLCNNDWVDQVLKDYSDAKKHEAEQQKVHELLSIMPKKKIDTCAGCYKVVGTMEEKFNEMDPNNVLEGFLKVRLLDFSTFASRNLIIYMFGLEK